MIRYGVFVKNQQIFLMFQIQEMYYIIKPCITLYIYIYIFYRMLPLPHSLQKS